MFQHVGSPVDFAAEEQKVLELWRREETFARSLDRRRQAPEYTFYDGPPFATGLPHYGNLLAGIIKDVVPRYQTMRGRFCDRVFGWDCHGLPVENEVEKTLGINSKHEIEQFGVAQFNEACRGIVLKHTADWERIVERLGRWVDFRRGYRTMDRDYMESIWWVFRQLWDQGLVYEGQKIMWYCPRCATPLSNFEVNLGYVEVEDPAITVRFRAVELPNTYLLAWTTTPWTLPANLALTVGPDLDYVEVQDRDGTRYILGEALVGAYWRKDPPAVVRRLKGRDVVGLTYEPLFPYFAALGQAGAYRVIAGDFVSTAEGTGIVHTAPGFGEDDAAVGKANQVPTVCPLDDEGCYTREVTDYAGRFVKDCDADIIQRLKAEGKLVHRGVCKHNYPHCWRCDRPLLNKAIATWFIRVEQLKERMLKANAQIRWVPAHLQAGRFGHGLATAPDWAVSRNRYWGCPLPLWRNRDTGEVVCVGSIAELEQRSGRRLDDIHKHFVDDLRLPGRDGTELRRVPEVLDCWFESGAMPYAQRHYPFANREWLETHFPADFIAEGLDQTRGWFYTLVVLGAALFDQPAFRNVIVNGLILAEDGKKLSKSKRNYADPLQVMDTYGADALRLYLLSSAVVRAEDLVFSETGIKETMRAVLLPFWNAYSFFVTYARVDGWTPGPGPARPPEQLHNPLDQWIRSRLAGLMADVRQSLDHYDLQPAAQRFAPFVDELTNWYIRRSRRRFWKSQNDADKQEAYATLYHVLVTFCQTAAPLIPFVTETVYRNLRAGDTPESVHWCDYPEPHPAWPQPELDRRMQRAMTAVSLGRYLRSQSAVRIRQPLPEVVLVSHGAEVRQDLMALQEVIAEELNVKRVVIEANEGDVVHLSAKASFKRLGPRLGSRMKAAAAAIAKLTGAEVDKLRAGGIVTLGIGAGDTLALVADDIEVNRETKPGLVVANAGDITVALNLKLTPELELEGLAREFVHAVQERRKALQLEVADRIRVQLQASARVHDAVRANRSYVMSEILAEELAVAADPDTVGHDLEVADERCRVWLRKA